MPLESLNELNPTKDSPKLAREKCTTARLSPLELGSLVEDEEVVDNVSVLASLLVKSLELFLHSLNMLLLLLLLVLQSRHKAAILVRNKNCGLAQRHIYACTVTCSWFNRFDHHVC